MSAESTYIPPTSLPITYAVVVMKMNEGASRQLAAIQWRADGHPMLVGDVKACTPHFINAMKAAVRESFLEELPVALDALAAESAATSFNAALKDKP